MIGHQQRSALVARGAPAFCRSFAQAQQARQLCRRVPLSSLQSVQRRRFVSVLNASAAVAPDVEDRELSEDSAVYTRGRSAVQVKRDKPRSRRYKAVASKVPKRSVELDPTEVGAMRPAACMYHSQHTSRGSAWHVDIDAFHSTSICLHLMLAAPLPCATPGRRCAC
jgi:hypothetical protein